MERIIHSNIDTDQYKLTMGQFVHHNFPNLQVGYEFINRGKTQFPDNFDLKLQEQIEMMADLKLLPTERLFLEKGCNGVFAHDYLDWFSQYQFNPNEVTISRENGSLALHIDGPWDRTIYWEVPLMALISELYFKEMGQQPAADWEQKTIDKALFLRSIGASIIDFGSRRRFSEQVHNRVVEIFKKYGGKSFLGTSNLALALKHDLTPMGTSAHELFMAMAGLYGPENANKMVLDLWTKEYNGKLATALTDTFTTDIFLRDFKGQRTEVFKGLRQDSGSPEAWTDKVIAHLVKLGIDPLTRTALYSDSLNPQRVLEIMEYSRNRIKTLFGIGTNLTNDVGAKPLNMVIKLLYIMENNQRKGLCKISDDPGKISGDPEVIANWPKRLGLEINKKAA